MTTLFLIKADVPHEVARERWGGVVMRAVREEWGRKEGRVTMEVTEVWGRGWAKGGMTRMGREVMGR